MAEVSYKNISKIPSHVAIIMDGNRRWAKKRKLPVIYGHKKGVDTVYRIVKAAKELGIKYLTLYAFSTENWNRSKNEVKALMFLLKKVIKEYKEELYRNDIQLKVSGRLSELDDALVKEINDAVQYLKNGKAMILNIALNYGGRIEIIDAINSILKEGLKKVDEKTFSKYLYTYPLPDPDLIIRTSGEMRLSNFLIWQSAYSEFYVTETLWPDFSKEDFIKALVEYSKRERRIGT